MSNLRSKIRGVALSIAAPAIGFALIILLEMALKIEIPKLLGASINFVVVALIAFILFPKQLGIPFGRIATREWLKKIGLYWPEHGWKHVVLGMILAGCTLTGMLAASLLTGKYVVDTSAINLPHLAFSLNPALWEELFYRGVMVILLYKMTKSLQKAFVIQIAIFGLTHIKGVDIWALVDLVSVAVIAVGFTYVAYKTRTLVAGIVFHYFHDALLFFVQLPKNIVMETSENVLFYGLLWLMVGVGCGITKIVSERLDVRSTTMLYNLGNDIDVEGQPAMPVSA